MDTKRDIYGEPYDPDPGIYQHAKPDDDAYIHQHQHTDENGNEYTYSHSHPYAVTHGHPNAGHHSIHTANRETNTV